MAEPIFRRFEMGDQPAFRELNEAWVTRYFRMEEKDHEMLGDPVRHVIAPGGDIVMAVCEGEAVGCCALIRMEGDVFEVAKMT
ncbi:MAG TPA: hypothetical protein VNH18_12520, partial [Bryobacteraceae bacterium]|nr:hypothetical protein [Bryobacteraceae bacterium]